MHSRRHPTILERLEAHSRRHNPGLHRRAARHTTPPRGLRWQDRVLLTLACVLTALLLLRVETARAQDAGEWGLTLAPGGQARTALALETTLHAEVTGLLARVHVVQSFRNDSDEWVEGTYRFPLPDGAAVDRLYVKVGERVLEGVIEERDTARRVYQQARDEGRAASLVSQERTNQFRTQLANIGPGEEVHVMIAYLANVDYRDGAFRLRLPTTFTPRWGAEAQPATGAPAPRPSFTALGGAPDHRLSLEVDLAAGLPLASVESLHHDVDIESGEAGYRVTLLDPDARSDRDFELRWTPEFGDLPQPVLSTWSDGRDVYAQLMLVPPRDQALTPRPREVVFVIDTSGSMAGESLAQAQAALHQGLEALNVGDRFNLVQFNSVTEPLFAGAVAATPGNRARARSWINALQADGGTDMAPALREALRGGKEDAGRDVRTVRQVVFITDGSVGNERALLREIAERLGDSRLFTVAIGAAPNGWFMRKAAEIGRGHHTHIGRQEDVVDTMTALWDHIRVPAVSDVCVDWGPGAEAYPEVIPDLYAGQPLWAVARLPRQPEAVRLCGQLEGRPWGVEAWPETVSGRETLATLWARRKVEALQDSVMFGANPDHMRAEITAVALEHGLLTPYTSLVAVDRTPSRPASERLARSDVPSLLPAGSAAGVPFPATATGWKAQFALSLLVLAISGALFLRPFASFTAFRSPVRHLRRALLAARS